jgi:hypothetical protein
MIAAEGTPRQIEALIKVTLAYHARNPLTAFAHLHLISRGEGSAAEIKADSLLSPIDQILHLPP